MGASKMAQSEKKSLLVFDIFEHFETLQITRGLWKTIGYIASTLYYLL